MTMAELSGLCSILVLSGETSRAKLAAWPETRHPDLVADNHRIEPPAGPEDGYHLSEDLVDQLFNSSEKRLARTLLLLARYGKEDQPLRLPKMSQETLAEMVGTTRSRVNFFMNKFRDLGFIEYNGDIKVNSSLLTVVLHD